MKVFIIPLKTVQTRLYIVMVNFPVLRLTCLFKNTIPNKLTTNTKTKSRGHYFLRTLAVNMYVFWQSVCILTSNIWQLENHYMCCAVFFGCVAFSYLFFFIMVLYGTRNVGIFSYCQQWQLLKKVRKRKWFSNYLLETSQNLTDVLWVRL